jgi:RNA polymerase sigma-70 factor (ECF subfamily)
MKNPLAEKILFLRVKNKDHEAYGQFYDLYVDRIYRFIFFKINSEDDAKDLTSEVFLKTWQYIKDNRNVKNLNAFIYMVARNSVIDFYRSRSKKQETEELIGESHNNISDDSLLLQKMKEFEVADLLKALNTLKDEYREIIILRYLDELSVKEIALVLKKSPGAVRILVYRALNALKKSVGKQ